MKSLDADSILSLRPPVVELALPGGVVIPFRTLSGKDLDAIVARLELPAVEFAVETLACQAQDLPNASSVLRQVPRPTLLKLIRSWAAHPNTLNAARSEIRSFVGFKEIVERKVNEWLRPIRELAKRLSSSIAPLTVSSFPRVLTDELAKIEAACRGISAMIEDTTTQITEAFSAAFRASLPSPEAMQGIIEDMERGKEYLDAHDYGFAAFDMSPGGLRLIARDKPDSRKIHAVFLQSTRDPDFAKRLLDRLAQSKKLRRREPIVRAILNAHVGRSYALSVPCLYAQLEGILTDLLILEGLARRSGSRALATDSGMELHGLMPKARMYGEKHTTMRLFVTGNILKGLSPGRNKVLHGATTDYRQAKRSARLLLLVDALTYVVVETETKD